MISGITLPLADVPLDVMQLHRLGRRIHDRQGALEVQFLARERECVLPVLHAGQFHVLPWGNRRGDSRTLPTTLWTSLATIEAGGWLHTDAEACVIPATLGLDGGIWFPVQVGVRSLVVTDERGVRRVYVAVEPADHYYAIMCKSRWMACVATKERT